MNVIYGLYQPTEGEILVRGKPVEMSNPNDAIALGIGMVHQHFQLVPVMTVAENVMLGDESTKYGLLDTKLVAERITELSERYGLAVDPYAMVEDLPVGVRQRVEIVKTLYREADILILDEPTAVLTPQEIEGLFDVMQLLSSQGKSIIFISHKLKEVLAICGRVGRAAQRQSGRRGQPGRGDAGIPGRHDGGPRGDPDRRKGCRQAAACRSGNGGRLRRG